MSSGRSKYVAYIESRSATSSMRESAPYSAGFDERVRACQLVVGDGLAGHAPELLVEDGLDRRRVRLGARGDPPGGDRRAGHEREREERDVLGDLLITHEPAMEAAAPAAREDLGRDLDRIELARPERRAAVAHVDPLERHVIGHDLARPDRPPRRRPAEHGQLGIRLDRPEQPLGRVEDSGFLDVARDGQHRVVGHVVRPEERVTSSRLAASRSAIEPIGVWWYGWPSGKTAAMSFS